MKKLLSLILTAILIFQFIPVHAAEKNNYFYLFAASSDKILILSEKVNYAEGQTLKEALIASSHSFDGIEENCITAIDGVYGNYSRLYDDSGFDLNVPASSVSAVYFTERTDTDAKDISLILSLAAYIEKTDNIKNFPEAKEAYENALHYLRKGKASQTEEVISDLTEAIKAYDKIINGKKFDISFNIINAARYKITLTDEYANEYTSESNMIKAPAGKYSFRIENGINRTEGEITVTKAMSVNVTLPAGEWFGTVELRNKNGEAYEGKLFSKTNTLFCSVPDIAGSQDVYLYALQGKVPNTSTKIRAIYLGTDGVDKSSVQRSWNSSRTVLTYLLDKGMNGKKFDLEAQYIGPDGFTQIQKMPVEILRTPTLSELAINGESGRLNIDFSPLTLSYTAVTTADTHTVEAVPFGEGYSVDTKIYDNMITVSVTAEKQTTEYKVQLDKKTPAKVKVSVPAGITSDIYNSSDEKMTETNGVYKLIPDEEYRIVSTKDTYYHAEKVFTAKDGITVTAPAPKTDMKVFSVVLYNTGSQKTRVKYASDKTFSENTHEITYFVPDANSTVYAQADGTQNCTVTAKYRSMSATNTETDGKYTEKTITRTVSAEGLADVLTYAVAPCGKGQNITLEISKTENDIKYYGEYRLTLSRTLHLASMGLTQNGKDVLLTDKNGTAVSFDRDIYDYYISVNDTEHNYIFNGSFINESEATACCGGYFAEINGEGYENISSVSITPPIEKEQTVEIIIKSTHGNSTEGVYRLHFIKKDPVKISFTVSPKNANIFIKNILTGETVHGNNNIFELLPSAQYSYAVTYKGYKGIKESFTCPETTTEIKVTLKKAPERTVTEHDVFSAVNGATDAKIPFSEDNAVLYWATKLGSGYSSDAAGCPVIVDDFIYDYAGTTLYKIDKVTGEVLAEGTMDHSSSFAINAPTCAQGMLFIGLSDGCVQAFDADTLESLWIYHDELGGQPNSPIIYRDGYIYTGFWQGETLNANYVCLSVTDEDTTKQKEEKTASWTYTQKGGFYRSGAYICDDYMLLGTDDGESGCMTGHAELLSLETKTGRIKNSIILPKTGDMRSTIVKDGNYYYFTTKGGQFYRITVDKNGKITKTEYIDLYNYSDLSFPAMSTSTPAIYNGRAYIGVSGTSQFTPFSGHNITVIDLDDFEIAYTVRTRGYPQTSGLLTTAYDEGDGTVYVYFFDNFTPGKLRVLKDRKGARKPLETATEKYTSKGVTTEYETVPVLFTPSGEQAQYALCDPIADKDGTLYFKNDSAYLMALGSTPEKLEVTSRPEKTSYITGEVFSPKGMKISAVYTNGTKRDITKYVSFSPATLTKDDTDFEIRFEHTMYKNEKGKEGQIFVSPSAVIKLTVKDGCIHKYTNGKYLSPDIKNLKAVKEYTCAICGEKSREYEPYIPFDADNNGKVTTADARLTLRIVTGLDKCTKNSPSFLGADTDNDGKLTADDSRKILRRVVGLD